ncbi:MAG: hypothetical protein IAI49_14030 [Candidatus Eremiobacteraeota bacterium]|nr:hypothetical protein [Candidatus Eremiobacteraeota bacterium]
MNFTTTANSAGQIAIVLSATTDNAFLNGLEIYGGGATPPPTPAPTATPSPTPTPTPTPLPTPPAGDVVAINSGGSASGGFVADTDYVGPGSWVDATTHAVDISGVSSPAPEAVYQDNREGPTFTYTIPGLVANANYSVRLHFTELWWSQAGKRLFNVSLGSKQVLTNFDIFATAGAQYKAVVKTFATTANSSGQIVATFQETMDNAAIGAIEVQKAGATPTPTPTATPTASPAPSPTPVSTAFVDWPTYGYDNARDGYNPSTSAFTPAQLPNLHTAWNVSLYSGAQTQPIVATNVAGHAAVLVVGTGNGYENAYDGLSGTRLWSQFVGKQNLGACGTNGVAGTAQYDAALGAVFVAAGNNATTNHVILYRLNVATGAITGQVDLSTALLAGESTSAHTAVTLANGLLYIGEGSNCEAASWRGQVVAINPSTLAVSNTFYATYGHGGNYGGGGIWAWGGVSADPSGNIFFSAGNAETANTYNSGTISPPFVVAPTEYTGYAEHLVETNGALTSVIGSNYPGFNFAIGGRDLDYVGVPVIFKPLGCNEMAAAQGKGGTLVVTDTTNYAATPTQFAFSTPSGLADYMGNPAYSPLTGYVYAAISSSTDSLAPPGLAAIGSCGKTMVWHSQFGPDSFAYQSLGATPRSAPTVTAGGIVFLGTPCTTTGSGGCGTPGALSGAVWAIDASTGNVLGGGNPILYTGDNVRMAPTIDGKWMWVLDDSGNFYGLTVDTSVPGIAIRHAASRGLRSIHWGAH